MMHILKSVPATANSLLNPDNPIALRLRQEMQERNITATELARQSGVKTSFLYDILRGKSSHPSPVKLAQVSRALGIGISALLENAPGEPGSHDAMGKDYIAIPALQPTSSGIDARPLLFLEEWIHQHMRVSASRLRIFSISGDHMEPFLRHNDMVLVDTSQTYPSPAGVFMVACGNTFSAKRLEFKTRSRHKVRVISDNPRYSADERILGDMTIAGRIVWFSRAI